MGICPNCGSWVDEGDICHGCGASGSYITSEDEDEDETYNPPVESRADRLGKQAWDLYLDENYDDAIYKINQALDFDDRHAENWNKKAIILEGLKMYATSENCYNKSLELSKRNMVYDNKARMLFRWAHKLLEESKDIPDGSNKLEEAKQKCIKAMKALPGENSEEDINQYLRLWDSINFYIGYERKFKRNIETLKKYDKSELFTITGINYYKNDVQFNPGLPLKLVKEPDNEFDKDAIAVYAEDKKIGYVANSDYTKYKLTSSASELQNKIPDTAKGSYLFYLERYVEIQFPIGRIIK